MDSINVAFVRWRAISNPSLQHTAYIAIIMWEALTATVCITGAFLVLKRTFFAVKIATLGLVMGFFLFMVGFVIIAGGWFYLWDSAAAPMHTKAIVFSLLTGSAACFVALAPESWQENCEEKEKKSVPMSKIAEQSKRKLDIFQLAIYSYIAILALSIPLIIYLDIFTSVGANVWQTIPLLVLLYTVPRKREISRSIAKKIEKDMKREALIEDSRRELARLSSELTDNEKEGRRIWESYLRVREKLGEARIKDRALQQAFDNWNRAVLDLFRKKILSASSDLMREIANRLNQNHIPLPESYDPKKIQKHFEANPDVAYTAHFLNRNLIENSVYKLINDYSASLSVYKEWMEEKRECATYLKHLVGEMLHFEKHQDTTDSKFPFTPI